MPAPDNCLICRRQPAGQELSGELVYQDENWTVRHSGETNILGYLLLESRRHYLDLSEAAVSEAQSFGPLLASLVRCLRSILPCERVYTFTLAEMVPHFHVHIIPRTAAMPRGFRGRGIMSYPLSPGPDQALVSETCARIKRELKALSLKV